MSDTAAPQPDRRRMAIAGPLLGLAVHAVIFAAAYLAPRIRPADPGDEFGDLATVAVVLVVGEALAALVCVSAGIAWVRRGRRNQSLGLVVGWLVGLVVGWWVVHL